MEDKIIRIQAAVDELTDTLEVELNQVAEMMDNGDFSTAREKIRSMIKSITGEEDVYDQIHNERTRTHLE